jgi:hypothetical protein
MIRLLLIFKRKPQKIVKEVMIVIYEFTIKDLSSMSGYREINSSDISVVGLRKLKKLLMCNIFQYK